MTIGITEVIINSIFPPKQHRRQISLSAIGKSIKSSPLIVEMKRRGCSNRVIKSIFECCNRHNSCIPRSYGNLDVIDFHEFNDFAIVLSNSVPNLEIIDINDNRWYLERFIEGVGQLTGEEKIISCESISSPHAFILNIGIRRGDVILIKKYHYSNHSFSRDKAACGGG